MTQRLQFILIGLLGGLAFWGLFDAVEGLRQTPVFVPAVVLAGSFFFGALAMTAELGLRRAVLFSGLIGAVAAGLAALEALAFPSGSQMLQSGHVPVALVVLGSLPVPFAVGFGLGGRAGLTDYRVLFIESWNILVRYLAAWLFVGVMMLVLWLLGALLDLVGVDLLSRLFREDLALWLSIGATLGLALSVVTEMPDMVSPYLLLRLLRLLAPLVLLVETVFVAAVPVRGLTALFGDLSVASALLATALASIALVAVVVDQDENEAAHGPVLTWSARGLMGLLPVLAGLAIWALVLRVQEYGWTPGRVTAMAVAAVVAGYALAYLAALSTGGRWMEKVRQAHVALALAIIALAAVWLTPAISPEAIAVRSQMARFASGQAVVAQLPLWQLAHDWGRSGEAALADLRGRAQEDAALARALARLDSAATRWDFGDATPPVRPEHGATLREGLRVLPAGADLPEGLIEAIAATLSDGQQKECAVPLAGSDLPGCVLVLADLVPHTPGPEAVFLDGRAALGGVVVFVQTSGRWAGRSEVLIGSGAAPAAVDLIGAVLRGPVVTKPVPLQALRAGDWQITVSP